MSEVGTVEPESKELSVDQYERTKPYNPVMFKQNGDTMQVHAKAVHASAVQNQKLSDYIHYLKIEFTPTHGASKKEDIDFSKTEKYFVQFTQVKIGEDFFRFSSMLSNFDYSNIIGVILLVLFVFGCSEPKTREEQNIFYTDRLNPMMLTYFFGSLVVSIFFNILNTQVYSPSSNSMSDQVLMKKQMWDKGAMMLCFLINSFCSTYLGILKFFSFYEENFIFGRLQAIRKRLWCFQRIELMSMIVAVIFGMLSSYYSITIVQDMVFLLNVWLIADILTISKLRVVVILSIGGIVYSLMVASSSMIKFNMTGSLVSENFVGMPVNLQILRFAKFVGSDYVTFSLCDFVIPTIVYKFMCMLDLKREDWLMTNQMLLGSNHPRYGDITGRLVLAVAVYYVILSGVTMNSMQFYSTFLLLEIIVFAIVMFCYKDYGHFKTFGRDLMREIPNLDDEIQMLPF